MTCLCQKWLNINCWFAVPWPTLLKTCKPKKIHFLEDLMGAGTENWKSLKSSLIKINHIQWYMPFKSYLLRKTVSDSSHRSLWAWYLESTTLAPSLPRNGNFFRPNRWSIAHKDFFLDIRKIKNPYKKKGLSEKYRTALFWRKPISFKQLQAFCFGRGRAACGRAQPMHLQKLLSYGRATQIP